MASENIYTRSTKIGSAARKLAELSEEDRELAIALAREFVTLMVEVGAKQDEDEVPF